MLHIVLISPSTWFNYHNNTFRRSQWPSGRRRRSAAARLLGLWVRIPPEEWMFACVECCVLSGRGLCDGLITRPEESYRLWCVVLCDLEISRIRWSWHALGRSATGKKNNNTFYMIILLRDGQPRVRILVGANVLQNKLLWGTSSLPLTGYRSTHPGSKAHHSPPTSAEFKNE